MLKVLGDFVKNWFGKNILVAVLNTWILVDHLKGLSLFGANGLSKRLCI